MTVDIRSARRSGRRISALTNDKLPVDALMVLAPHPTRTGVVQALVLKTEGWRKVLVRLNGSTWEAVSDD